MEENLNAGEIIAKGYKAELVLSILASRPTSLSASGLPVGLKVTEKSFGYGRKMPIVKDLGYIKR